jgi:hypothetical protein
MCPTDFRTCFLALHERTPSVQLPMRSLSSNFRAASADSLDYRAGRMF